VNGEAHGHTHGLVDRSIMRSRAGLRAVLISLGVLGATGPAGQGPHVTRCVTLPRSKSRLRTEIGACEGFLMLTLSEALTKNKLDEFVAQEEKRGVGPVSKRKPSTAINLSLFLPGLGQVYCGALGRGLLHLCALTALLVVAIVLLATQSAPPKTILVTVAIPSFLCAALSRDSVAVVVGSILVISSGWRQAARSIAVRSGASCCPSDCFLIIYIIITVNIICSIIAVFSDSENRIFLLIVGTGAARVRRCSSAARDGSQ